MKLIENKKLFGKLNIVDMLIILVVICAGIFIVVRFVVPKNIESAKPSVITMVFYSEESPEFAVKAIKVGDKLSDDIKNCDLGTVKEVIVDKSVNYAINDKGEFVNGSKDGYNSVKIVAELSGEIYDNGMIVGVTKYGIGHSFTLTAGMARIYGRVFDIQGEK